MIKILRDIKVKIMNEIYILILYLAAQSYRPKIRAKGVRGLNTGFRKQWCFGTFNDRIFIKKNYQIIKN